MNFVTSFLSLAYPNAQPFHSLVHLHRVCSLPRIPTIRWTTTRPSTGRETRQTLWPKVCNNTAVFVLDLFAFLFCLISLRYFSSYVIFLFYFSQGMDREICQIIFWPHLELISKLQISLDKGAVFWISVEILSLPYSVPSLHKLLNK